MGRWMMSDEMEPVNQYRNRAARLRTLASDFESPAVVEILLGIAVDYERLVRLLEARVAQRQSGTESQFKARGQVKVHDQVFVHGDVTRQKVSRKNAAPR
jgi:hypothetical protein